MSTRLVVLGVLLAVATVMATELEQEAQSTYIVHVAPAHAPLSSRRLFLGRAYTSFLLDFLPAHLHQPTPSLLYTYAHAATGFAARLTERQAEHLAGQSSVLDVVPDEVEHPHTTLSPSFLELSASSGLIPASSGGTDIVIGVIDRGIYPKNRPSFAADPTLPPPPPTFRGECVSTPSFNASAYCNNKLVGAKFFYKGYEAAMRRPIDETKESKSPLDTHGHGTHTASTAAGSAVQNAGFYHYAKGKAMGVAPGARIAAYKVCWNHSCTSTDMLAGIDEAIADGVDVISISLGRKHGKARKLYRDHKAIGAFRAIRKGIVVSCSAGNLGPDESTVVNIAPWMLTVGASTINRRFPAVVVLGNGKTFNGTSLYVGRLLGPTKLPLVYGGDVGSKFCKNGSLDATAVTGKIVLCYSHNNKLRVEKGLAVKLAGGAGAILASPRKFGEQASAVPHLLPAAAVPFAAAKEIRNYIKSHASRAVATMVFHGTNVGRWPSAPRVASFSSRGPIYLAPKKQILKPDVIAPGVDILASWTGENSPTGLAEDTRRVAYNIISGTSMACPHVSGIAALLRQARPEWSPAAIKSAMMTTAYVLDNAGNVIKDMSTGKASTPFVRGAGHVDPNRALDPGLVYDADADDYISFMCALNYTTKQIARFAGNGSGTDCSTSTDTVGDLNYPAFSAVFSSYDDEVTQRRVVRNVGSNINAVYKAKATSPDGVHVRVTPRRLRFNKRYQTREYKITFTSLLAYGNDTEKYTFGSIVWSDGEHEVASPIAITWPVCGASAM